MRPLALLLAGIMLLAGCLQAPQGTDASGSPGSPGASSPASGPSSEPSGATSGSGGPTTTTTSSVRPAEWTPEPWADVPCRLPPALPGTSPPSPELLALDGQGMLTRLAWRNGQATPVARAGPGIVHAAPVGTGAVTADRNGTAWHLVARGMDLHERARRAVPEVTALAVDGQTVYAATRWNLTAYDLDLRELGRLAIGTASQAPGKAVDAIAVHAGHAYLLDDVVAPFWVFRIDVRQSSAMRQVVAHQVSSSTAPTLQWLNASSGTWYVERNFFGMGGGGRSVVALDAERGTEGRSITVAGSSYPFLPDDPSPRREQGYNVFGSGFALPAWAVVGRGNVSLARVEVVEGAIRRSCAAPLEGDTSLAAFGEHVVTWGRNHVQVWEARGQVRAREEATLPAPAVGLWPVGGRMP